MLALAALTCSFAAAASAEPGVEPPRHGSISGGLGGSWIFGGNAPGYDGGVAERVVADLALGRAVDFSLELDHARHGLEDAAAYFPDASSPAEAVTGFRDYLVVDAGFRARFDATPGAPALAVHVFPYLRPGIGLALTSTLLDAPSFAGRVVMRSRTAWPAPGIAAGAEVRIRPWISLRPNLKLQVQIVEDVAESAGGPTHVGAEWRLQPALDASINF